VKKKVKKKKEKEDSGMRGSRFEERGGILGDGGKVDSRERKKEEG